MTITHKIEIGAPSDAVFAHYADLSSWPIWDAEVLEVHLPGGLVAGSTGWLKPRKGPKAKVRVMEVVPNASFTMEGLLPLCRIEFGHDLQARADRTIAVHAVRFTGPLAFLFRRLIGRGIDKSLPQTLAGLKRVSEQRGSRG